MTSLYGLVQRLYKVNYPPRLPKSTEASVIRFGILGAAKIAPTAFIKPALSHPEVVVYAVAARNLEKAREYAKTHGIEKVYGGSDAYQKLLDDPNVDAIYNPLPNGLHHEWTMKALHAGKHVLLEKPSSDTAEDTREMFEYAQSKGLVLLEAFHYRFHPAVHRLKAIFDSGELGPIKHAEAVMKLPKGYIPDGDIRFDYNLGGGTMMDMGCYVTNLLRYIFGTDPLEVLSATADVVPTASGEPSKIDLGTTATFAFPGDATGTATCHMRMPHALGFIPRFPVMQLTVTCERGELSMFNFMIPTMYHTIQVVVREGKGGKSAKKRVEKVYKPTEPGKKGEDWWITYRYQLEAFVDKVKGREPDYWISAEDSISNIFWVQKVYEKTGLGSRPKSTFKLPVD
ncbi:Gfo/Idh/MocA family oxidoreductase [Phanerochaete sordida]|uniref:D-xylose 1-dehydrogenase (NADP(+), D-xylono-1,5-lactone-forming) n=1 Tax=Phanerochaete sordida TaxID=48140 RepID=A0A9P3GP20_9APHY|nr:Gfo/Idh/MocA family oxidoreductase [Phanerochaete sordida]